MTVPICVRVCRNTASTRWSEGEDGKGVRSASMHRSGSNRGMMAAAVGDHLAAGDERRTAARAGLPRRAVPQIAA